MRQVAPSRLRLLYRGLTIAFVGIAIAEFLMLYEVIAAQRALGADLVFYRGVAERWLDSGVLYTQDQLSGPYAVTTLVDNLYPPHALGLFVPFVVLPAALWFVVPVGVVAAVVWRLEPAPWAVAVIALILALPKTSVVLLYGNTDLWLTAFVAGAVVFGWPALLVSIKPSLLPFALLGLRRRSWWLGAIALVIVSVPVLPLWLQWSVVIRNSSVTAGYSVANLPMLFLPVVAWLGSRRRRGLGMPTWIARRFAERGEAVAGTGTTRLSPTSD
jgi:hypothetical protein